MDASSRGALAEVRQRLAELTRPASGLLERARDVLTGQERAVSSEELLGLAEELFSVARLLDGQVSLRRALSDPSGSPADRAGVARRLLSGRVSETTLDLVETAARQRWSRPLDLVEATEALATDAALDAAEAQGELDDVEDQLFRFGRIVGGDAELSRILSDRTAPAAGKAALLDRLVAGRVSPITAMLVRNHLTGRAVGNAENVVERLSEAASTRRGQSVARVTTAVALTAAQERRLTELLSRLYNRSIGLQVIVDPGVLGGLVIRVGDEVIDGSVAHRLEVAGRRLVG
ncbi:F0F1 ATP synthase subunit delta [Geodermatophilus sp. DSM 45219]|uniref:F0F1 ATP synthase subunit delta n=1 Tax=Geodermatophilus sp. DSM 45219 TaxID=1881103 RepID=UPI0008830A90|nr:F0F1 ATP synthase subunit delta [Geodermatophilus sp. DSM 45219]SDO29379.1 F-type H+-transporting ATPase subunit delta [Geodermatophilus sp. DSM 45219]